MKTIDKLRELPEFYSNKAIKERINRDNLSRNKFNRAVDSFTWSTSKDGFLFWSRVNDILIQHEEECHNKL